MSVVIEKFKKLINKIGFTWTEAKVLIFLLTAFLIGVVSYYFKTSKESFEYEEFNYSSADSAFLSSSVNDSVTAKILDKKVDSEQELLDFSANELSTKKDEANPFLKGKVDLNSIGKELLTKLPGIGEKTAERIIEYREKHGKFRNLSELLNIKGIGEAKLEALKEYLIIEK